MSRETLYAALFTAAALLAPAAAAATVPVTSQTVGVRVGDAEAGGFIDVILPVVATEKGIGFINPRFSLEKRGENELNVGAGWRHLAFGDRVLLGGNIYYDSRSSEHDNRFSQLGAGLEVLSPWLDARANLYLPEDKRELIASEQAVTSETSVQRTSRSSESLGDPYAAGHQVAQDFTRTSLTTTTTTTTTTRRLFEQFESALQGFDAEIGALLPLPSSFPAVRLFGGYYSFEDAFGNRVEGPKGRLEMRIGTFLVLDGELFDDDLLNGTSYFAGARLRAPFDVAALFAGRNPFAGWNAPVDGGLASRMTEMVMRDPRVRTGESEPAENEGARKVEVAVEENVSTKTSTETFVLLDNVTFVDDDAVGGPVDGTAEHPYAEIQAAVDGSGANANVYVHPGDYASVTLVPGVTLWGAGTAIAGYGGKQFGGEAYPTIGGASPAVTVATDTRVTGFRIVNTDDAGIYGEISSGTVTIDNNFIDVAGNNDNIPADGILLTATDAQVTISGNSISCVGGRGSGVALETYGSSSAILDGNIVLSDGPQRWGVTAHNHGSSLTVDASDNAITSGNIGLWVANWGPGSVTASASGNWVSARSSAMQFENGTGGFPAAAEATMTVTVRGNAVAESDIGLTFKSIGKTMTAVAEDNTLTHGSIGIEALFSYGVTDLTISGNALAGDTGGGGIVIYGSNDARTTVSLTGNTIYLHNDAPNGIEAVAKQSLMDVTASGNSVVAAGTDAIGFTFVGVSADVTLSASNNHVTGAAAADMELVHLGGAFDVNAAAPGAGGDLSGLNGGMNVVYDPDPAAFTFLP